MRIVVVGEGMLELTQAPGDGNWRLGHGGDTLNTALHLARFGRNVAYATAVGNDSFSDELRRAWQAEGLDTSLVLVDSERQPGLYTIRTDKRGERSFTYWRENSAARQLFSLPDSSSMIMTAWHADLLCFSLISLAILPRAGREMLLNLARAVRSRGGRVAFDGNYRPRLWRSVKEAQDARDEALRHCDIGLPTLDDEMALSGSSDHKSIAAHWSSRGVSEVVVKLGAHGCAIDGHRVVEPCALIQPVDTSGAGDAFNAGYLHARLNGLTAEEAAAAGNRLAGWVITQRGAVPARTADAPY